MEFDKDIDRIIYSYLEGSATETDLKELLNWIKQDGENLGYFNQICNLWENSASVSQHEFDEEVALNKLNNRIDSLKEKDAITFDEDNNSFIFWKVAAVAIILIGVAYFFYLTLSTTKKHEAPAYISAIAPKSQKSQLILSDGTKVWLNSGTTLKYKNDYGKTDRQIYLDGEAYFEVAKDPSKPFLVFASNIIVKALGTSFNVKCYSEDNTIETTLVEGKVQVSKNQGKIQNKDFVYLLPNQRAIFNRLDNNLVIASNENRNRAKEKEDSQYTFIDPKSIESVISWKNEELVFEKESFEELTKRLERWYNVEIKIVNPEVNLESSYTGKFVHNESLEQVLKIISRTTPIKYSFRNGEVLIEVKK